MRPLLRTFKIGSDANALKAWRVKLGTFELLCATLGEADIILYRALHLAPGALGGE